MIAQVVSLMPLNTTVNFQYRYDLESLQAARIIFQQGGIRRFYHGIVPAIAVGFLARFGDTAANAGVPMLLALFEATDRLPVAVSTAAASLVAGMWRGVITPLDVVKTSMQVGGKDARNLLATKFKRIGVMRTLYQGALLQMLYSILGHYPFFVTYNHLSKLIPEQQSALRACLRDALIGSVSSTASILLSNPLKLVITAPFFRRPEVTF